MNKSDLYDPKLIEDLYLTMQNCQVDDQAVLTGLRESLRGKKVLILAPGATLNTHRKEISEYIAADRPYVISTNFLPESFDVDMLFTSNRKRIEILEEKIDAVGCVLATSNLLAELPGTVQFIKYSNYLGEGKAVDNAGAMLIRVMKAVGVSHIALAGFDGFDVDSSNNYCVSSYKSMLERSEADLKNEEIGIQMKLALNDIPHEFITPTRYSI